MAQKSSRSLVSKCTYRNGAERCNGNAIGKSGFCDQHVRRGMSPEAAAEANALGKETAQALREELNVAEPKQEPTVWDVRPSASSNEVMDNAVADEDEVPQAARENPIRYAMDIAMQAIAEAYAEENEARAQGRAGRPMSPTDRARMTLAAYMPHLDDPAAMVNSKGESLVRPGWVPRWAKDKDEDGRPNTRRLRRLLAEGAEEVIDEDGRPLVGPLGRAIQMPPQVYAARVLSNSPSGAFDKQVLDNYAMDCVESVNSTAGRRVVESRPSKDHGSRWGLGG